LTQFLLLDPRLFWSLIHAEAIVDKQIPCAILALKQTSRRRLTIKLLERP
jgi:hypothetical protein